MLPLLRFSPILKRARWGGGRLGTSLNKPIGPENDYSESWEIVDRELDVSRLCGEKSFGLTLQDLWRNNLQTLLGLPTAELSERFPLLVKYLDATNRLSLQVHPNDEQAARFSPGERGKTEAWYIVDATPDAVVYVGVKPGVTLSLLKASLQDGTVEDLLNTIPVQRGDAILIPAGTLHAVGAGVLLLEIQQSSDITYRVHDWGWVDAQGLPRQLHLEHSWACLDLQTPPPRLAVPQLVTSTPYREEFLLSCPYFHLHRLHFTTPQSVSSAPQLRVLSVVAGSGEIHALGLTETLDVGDTILVPASTNVIQVSPSTPLEIIESRLGPAAV